MGRSPCCSKEGMNRGAWTVLEDKILTEYIKVHGEGRWRNLPKKAGLKRCGKSCRLRWLNYLRPDIKRGNITPDEEELIIRLHKLLGNRWSLIAGRLPGRTDNEIKNYWNTKIGKKRQENQSSAAGTPNNKSDDKKKKKSTGDGDGDNEPPSTNSAAAPPPPKMQPHVVHTKAMRCTKAFINPHPHKVLEHVKTNHPQVGPPSSIVRDRSIDQQADNYHYGSNNNGISSFTTGDVDFMMDFSMGELNLSDLLNSNFSADLCNFNYSDDNSTELSPSSTDQPLMFTGEMLEDWALKDGTTHQPNVNYFSSFIDSDGDWLRE